jgi:hypothetical protein
MAVDTVVLTEREVERLQFGGAETLDLINQALESDAVDRLLTIRDALSKYKKAVFWAMFLSTSLIMEGYDLVIVSELDVYLTTCTSAPFLNSTNSKLPTSRSPPSMAKLNSRIDLASMTRPLNKTSSRLPGNQASPIPLLSGNLPASSSTPMHKTASAVAPP